MGSIRAPPVSPDEASWQACAEGPDCVVSAGPVTHAVLHRSIATGNSASTKAIVAANNRRANVIAPILV